MIIGPRIVARARAPADAPQRDRHRHRAGRCSSAALCWLLGWRDFLLVWAPPALLAGSVGIWLFYVQHQFEDAYWQSADDWSYADAALRGSSYLKLPKVLQFFSGNIGLHHVHHLNARIPNYNLQRAHDENPIFHEVPTLSLWDGAARRAAQAVGRGPAQAGDVRQARRLQRRPKSAPDSVVAVGASRSSPVAVSDDAEVARARLEAIESPHRDPSTAVPSTTAGRLGGPRRASSRCRRASTLASLRPGRLGDPPWNVRPRAACAALA